MVVETFEKIKAIEQSAEEIIKQARQSSALSTNKTRKKHEQALATLKESLKKEAKAFIHAAEEEAKKEEKAIEAASKKEIDNLKKNVSPKIPLAKKEVLQCLS